MSVVGNLIHDSWGAGVMVFGLSDRSRNISNASISQNIFVRNGAIQTSADHGEIAFMEYGSTGTVNDNLFFASDPDPSFVFNERQGGTLDLGWTFNNNTIMNLSACRARMADTPAIGELVYLNNGSAQVLVLSRIARFNTTVLWTVDGSWPVQGEPGTSASWMAAGGSVLMVVTRNCALNIRFAIDGMLTSLTTTLVVDVPEPSPSSSLMCSNNKHT